MSEEFYKRILQRWLPTIPTFQEGDPTGMVIKIMGVETAMEVVEGDEVEVTTIGHNANCVEKLGILF